MPVAALGLRAFRREDDLIARLAARAQAFSMVAPTVDLASMVEVDEVNQQLLACGTQKALRVPTGAEARSTGKHRNVPTSDLLSALLTDGPSNGHWEDSNGAPSQILPLALLAEGSQLFLLLLLQGCAVLCLTVMWGQLVQQLLYSVFLPGTVDIGDLVLWEAAEKLVNLGGHGRVREDNYS